MSLFGATLGGNKTGSAIRRGNALVLLVTTFLDIEVCALGSLVDNRVGNAPAARVVLEVEGIASISVKFKLIQFI
jgi:hypothetical protein